MAIKMKYIQLLNCKLSLNMVILFVIVWTIMLYYYNLGQNNLTLGTAKEAVPQVADVWPVYNCGVFQCLTEDIIKKRNFSRKSALLKESTQLMKENAEGRKKSFETIFHNKVWPGQQKPNTGLYGSGLGSTVHYTAKVRQMLDVLIKKLKLLLKKDVIKMLDIPCGDLMWMSIFLQGRTDVNYTGMDIVPDIINHHKKVYANQVNRHFINNDIVKNPIGESYDFILSRHMMQHLMTSDTITVLKHLSDAGRGGWLMTTTVEIVQQNVELDPAGGRYRAQNLAIAPFSLADPVCLMEELSDNLYLAVYSLPLQ